MNGEIVLFIGLLIDFNQLKALCNIAIVCSTGARVWRSTVMVLRSCVIECNYLYSNTTV